MCKLGDIIVVNNYIAENGLKITQHSFIVIDDSSNTIKGLDYDIVTTVISSFKNNQHKLRKLRYKENVEITNQDLAGNYQLKKESYVKADKLFYFNKSKLDFYVFARVSDDFLDALLKVILELSEKERLTLITKNIENKVGTN